MNDGVSRARIEILNSLHLPTSAAGFRSLRRRQRWKIWVWEGSLRSMFVVKRLLDVALSSLGLILLAPVFLAAALAILVEDGWPVFYAQDRVGLNGRLFRFYKFRSMKRGADRMKDSLLEQNESTDGVTFKMRRDPRVTRVGRILRRYSVDELPQVLNVLMGDLAIVGPRPPVPREVAQYGLEERKRLHVKPGLTCFWQIQGRSEIPFNEQVRLDLEYIHSQGLWNDIVIILKTIPAVLLGRGAY